jgi:hypothetical protein
MLPALRGAGSSRPERPSSASHKLLFYLVWPKAFPGSTSGLGNAQGFAEESASLPWRSRVKHPKAELVQRVTQAGQPIPFESVSCWVANRSSYCFDLHDSIQQHSPTVLLCSGRTMIILLATTISRAQPPTWFESQSAATHREVTGASGHEHAAPLKAGKATGRSLMLCWPLTRRPPDSARDA